MQTSLNIGSVAKFRKLIKDKEFLNCIFTKKELDYCNSKEKPEISLAGKFSAKEGVIKLCKKPIKPKDIEILNTKTGRPEVYIKGKRKKRVHCSISHTDNHAIALVLTE